MGVGLDALDGMLFLPVPKIITRLPHLRYQNYLDLHDGQKSTAFILEGGIKNWLSTFEGQEDLIAYE